MGGAPERGDEKRQEDHAGSEVLPFHQRLERPDRTLGCGRARERWWGSRAGPEYEARAGGGDVERGAQKGLRVGAELVARALGGHGGIDDPRPVSGSDDDLLPADSLGEVRVVKHKAARPPGSDDAVDSLETQGREPSRTWPLGDVVIHGHEFRGTAAELGVEPARDLGVEARGVYAVSLLDRGDLGEVEDVMNEHVPPGQLDCREAVDCEIAERV